ncbi:MAG: ABC transporter permease, partial [Myxococcota bacterium]
PIVLWLGEIGVDLTSFSEALRELGIGVRLYPALELADLGIPIALAIVTAVLSALWPAIKAARLRPAEALRHV